MKITLKKRIDANTTLELAFDEDSDPKETLLKIEPFVNLPTKCGLCESVETTLETRSGGEYIFPGVKCKDCGAVAQFGERKSPKGAFFIKQWELYDGKKKESN